MSKQVLGVLCSGRGTDLQSIIDAIGRGEVAATIAVVLADKPDAYALTRAEKAGIKAVCIDRKQFDGRQPFEEALIAALDEAGVTLVVLAGFMRILTPYFVRHYAGRIMNIHPALLPSFPGAHAHRDVLAYGVKVSGCTVHFVDEGTDSGPIILQAAVPVLDDRGDTRCPRARAGTHHLPESHPALLRRPPQSRRPPRAHLVRQAVNMLGMGLCKK